MERYYVQKIYDFGSHESITIEAEDIYDAVDKSIPSGNYSNAVALVVVKIENE